MDLYSQEIQEKKKDLQKQPQTMKKMETGMYISIISLNANGLKAPTKRHRLAEWTQKENPYICCLQETHLRPKDKYTLKVRGWKNIFHANRKQKKAGVAILISDKTGIKIKKVTRDKGEHHIMLKGSIQEKDITTVNIYAPNIRAPQYIRQTLTDIKGETDSNIIIVGDFNTPLTPMDRSSIQKINKETQLLTLDEMNLIDILKTFQMQKNEFRLFLKCSWNLLQDRSHPGP